MSDFAEYETVDRCTMCGSREHAPMRLLPHIHHCAACGHRFLTPRPTQAAIVASYDLEAGQHAFWEQQRVGREIMWRKRATRVAQLKDGGHALDVGTGFGDFIRDLRDAHGWRVEGTEVSINALRRAREQHGLTVHHGQVEQLDLPEDHFDLITLWHVLEHLPYPGPTLDRLRRLLKPGGILVIAVPNDGLWPRLVQLYAKDILTRPIFKALRRPYRSGVDLWFGKPVLGGEIHLSFFSPKRLAAALELRGLSVTIRAVDDFYGEPTVETDRAYHVFERINDITGTNFGVAAFLAAVKDA
jgi:ubiquinone/menaquinone biosynthesis C-methylase UbiE